MTITLSAAFKALRNSNNSPSKDLDDYWLDLIDHAEGIMNHATHMFQDSMRCKNHKAANFHNRGLLFLRDYCESRLILWEIAKGNKESETDTIRALIIALANDARDVYAYFATAIETEQEE